MKYHPNHQRKMEMFISQQHRCHWCKRKCHLNAPKTKETTPEDLFTEDHVIPRSRGGEDDQSNLVGACWGCNHTRDVIEYHVARRKIIPHSMRKSHLMPVNFNPEPRGTK